MSVRDPSRKSGGPALRTNPRRTAPEHSVSLRQQPPIFKSPSSDDSERQSNGDVSAASNVAVHAEGPTPPSKKTSEPHNAEKWFDDSNKNAGERTNVRFINDDPPFYLPKQRSSEDEADGSGGRESSSQSGPPPGAFDLTPAAGGSNDSSRDDYRSVIDDLTVENQELKRKLRKYEGIHCAHMQEDKLFEIRVYKLSQARRRRLEKMLRDFVYNLGRSPPESLSSNNVHPIASIPYHYAPPVHAKRSGSSTSNKPVDSAYASMSASGPASVSHAQNNGEPRRPIRPAPEKTAPPKDQRVHPNPNPPKDQRVQSYLQTISRRLLPKYPPVMTEKTKKKLVVKRLEQLFVGRTGSSSKHSQSQQQQEVSQSAAIADRRETEAMGHRVQAEGRREAKMLLPPPVQVNSTADGARPTAEGGNTGGSSTAVTPDQRPTRPLDLDPSRAQNPAETISYMRHLGFSSPKMDPTQPYGMEEGWIYLNLLINMAQLHTLNVTPSFVRNAIRELSTQFELSEDGQNIRWKGGPQASKLSSDSSTNSDESADSVPDEQAGGRPRAQQKNGRGTASESLEHSRSRPPAHHTLRPVRNWPWPRTSEQFYSPIFYNPDDATSGSPSQEVVSSNSLLQAEDRSGGVSGGSTSLENPKSSSKTTDGETGNLIFYSRARFCTDLLGDVSLPPSNAVYERQTQEVLGVSRLVPETVPKCETKGPLSLGMADTAMEPEPDMSDVSELHGFDGPWPSTTGLPHVRAPRRLKASGVGGVTPADNFCIDVYRAHRRLRSVIARVSRRDLTPTPLPPPSYAFLPCSSSSSDSEESSDEEDDPPVANLATELNERHIVPPPFLGEFSSHSGSRGVHQSKATRTSHESSSLDMLEFARKADPGKVAQQELEYEEADQPRDAEHVPPPGSVAATVGDRSTFLTSQEDNASVDERHLRMMQDRKPVLKRERSDWEGSQRATKTRKEAKA